MANGVLMFFVHLLVAAHYVFALYYVVNHFRLPKTKEHEMFHSFGGHYRFLTNWDVLLQAIFFTICVINDLIGSNEVSPKKTPLIRKIKDFIHSSIGFPVAAFVTITFWGLYAVDRELVFPRNLDPYFPTWLNHIMHTNILVFTLVELFTSFRVYPSRKRGMGALTLFMLIYLVWTFVIFSKTGRWVYPVMEVLNWPQRIVFMLSLLVFAQILYFAGEFLNKCMWSKELSAITESKKSSKAKQR